MSSTLVSPYFRCRENSTNDPNIHQYGFLRLSGKTVNVQQTSYIYIDRNSGTRRCDEGYNLTPYQRQEHVVYQIGPVLELH